jgi:hypothetical protein
MIRLQSMGKYMLRLATSFIQNMRLTECNLAEIDMGAALFKPVEIMGEAYPQSMSL